MVTKMQRSTLVAAFRMGGFIGWSLTVMYICKQSLRYYHDGALLDKVNITFLTAAVIASLLLVVTLLLFDFEGLMSDKLLRWLPGVVMAESGIALSLANADTMNLFAAVAGAAAALGALVVMAQLLRVKVGQRMVSIGLAIAMGGIIRLLASLAIGGLSQSGYIIIAVAVGGMAILTVVHPRREDDGGPLVSLAEADPRTILSKLPYVYIILFFCAAAFFFSNGHIEQLAVSKLPHGYEGYDYTSMLGFILAALLVALFIKMPRLPLLFVFGIGISAAAAMLAGLPYLTKSEAAVFAVMSYVSLACIRACIYFFIVIFSLDRPHPLFYAMFGFAVAYASELFGIWLDGRVTTLDLKSYIWILIILMPLGGGLLAGGMRKYGYSQEKLNHRRVMRKMIIKKSEELELFDREREMIEAVVLDSSGIEELAARLLFSHNTIKALLRPVYQKLGVSGSEEMRDYFSKLADDQEKFIEVVRSAEEDKRIELRREQRKRRREIKEEQRIARERERTARLKEEQEELERKKKELELMSVLMGEEDTRGREPRQAHSGTIDNAVDTEASLDTGCDDSYDVSQGDTDGKNEYNGQDGNAFKETFDGGAFNGNTLEGDGHNEDTCGDEPCEEGLENDRPSVSEHGEGLNAEGQSAGFGEDNASTDENNTQESEA